MFDDRLIQLLDQAVSQTPAAAQLTPTAKAAIVQQLYSQLEQQLSYTILDRLSVDSQIQYLTMLEETVPQQAMLEFLQEYIPDINTVIEQSTQRFVDEYVQTANTLA